MASDMHMPLALTAAASGSGSGGRDATSLLSNSDSGGFATYHKGYGEPHVAAALRRDSMTMEPLMEPPYAQLKPHVPMPEGIEQQPPPQQHTQELDRKNGNSHLQLPLPPLPMAPPESTYAAYATGEAPLPLETIM